LFNEIVENIKIYVKRGNSNDKIKLTNKSLFYKINQDEYYHYYLEGKTLKNNDK